jgi:hypothetical protein
LYRFLQFFSQKLFNGIALINTFLSIAAHLCPPPKLSTENAYGQTKEITSDLGQWTKDIIKAVAQRQPLRTN